MGEKTEKIHGSARLPNGHDLLIGGFSPCRRGLPRNLIGAIVEVDQFRVLPRGAQGKALEQEIRLGQVRFAQAVALEAERQSSNEIKQKR